MSKSKFQLGKADTEGMVSRLWLCLLFAIVLIAQSGCNESQIDDDDVVPATQQSLLAIAPFSVAENSTRQFLFTLSVAQKIPVSFTWTVSTLTSPTTGRFTALTGSATIPAGATSVQVPIPIVNDTIYQSNQDFKLTLSNVTGGAKIPTASVTFTVVDDDLPPRAKFAVSAQSVPEGSGTANVVVTLSNPSAFTTTVSYGIAGTATSGSDFTASTASLIFAAGEISKTVVVTLIDDNITEPDETVIFTLSSVVGGSIDSTANTHTLTIANDDFAPTVTQVNSTKANGSYHAGTVPVVVQFSQAVNVTGSPTLTLETGTTDQTAVYASGSGTASLVFNYVIQSGDVTNDLNTVSSSALSLAGGTIKSAADGLDANVLLPVPGAANSLGANKNIVIDTVSPTLTNVTSTTANGVYKTGATISLQVSFSETVIVTGTPTLTLETGTTEETVSYVAGSGTSTLTFAYVVSAGDQTADLDYASTTALAGTFADAAGNLAVLTLPSPGAAGSLGYNKNLIVDGIAPSVVGVSSTKANGAYKAGVLIPVTVTFSENVYVMGTPTIALSDGQTASYVSGSGTPTLTFNYTVQAGDTAALLDYTSTSALSLSGGTINDVASNAAVLALAAPGTSGSLAVSRSLKIDTTSPVVTNVTSTTPNGTYPVSTVIHVRIDFSEAVIVTGTPTLVVSTGRSVSYTSGSGTSSLIFDYTVQAGDNSPALDVADSGSLSGVIADAAGNAASLTLPVPLTTGSLSANKSIAIDTTAPTLSTVTSLKADGSYTVGTAIDITVTFSEIVFTTGTPTLTLRTGASSTTAVNYSSGSGSTVLKFTYTVASGDASSDLDYASISSLSGTIADAAGNSPSLTLPAPGASGSLGANKNIVVDTRSPLVSNVSSTAPNASYKAGQVIPITVTFDEVIYVGGTPTLSLSTGRTASYASGSGTSTLTFNYTVISSDTSSDLDYASTTALSAAGGTIKDLAGNSAVLTLPATGSAGSLAANKNIVIDTTAPTVVSVSSTTANGAYRALQLVDITVTFSESVMVTGTPRLQLETGTTDEYATYVSGSGSSVLTFTYAIVSGDTSLDLDTVSTTSLGLNGGTIVDSAANAATLTLPTPGGTGSLGANKAIIIDTDAPSTPASIDDGIYSTSVNATPLLSWGASSDATSGIDHYEYALGTSAGGNQIVDWTSNGTALTKTITLLSLTDGATYYASVRAVDRAGNPSVARQGDGFRVDASAPVFATGSVNDGLTSNPDSSPAITWPAATDAYSGLAKYQVALGTSSGGSDTVTWTDVASGTTTKTFTGLALTIGATYYASVRAVDVAGNISSSIRGDGFLVGWLQQAFVKASDAAASDMFGKPVAISGNLMVVGSPTSGKGAAYVYVRTGTGVNATWSQQAKLTASNGATGDAFGTSVAINGTTIIVGAPNENGTQDSVSTTTPFFNVTSNSGAAYIFNWNATSSTWDQSFYVKAESNGASNNYFGTSVAITDTTIAVGAIGESSSVVGVQTSVPSNNGKNSSGAVYIYVKSGSTYAFQAMLKAPYPKVNLNFGSVLAMSADTIVVGIPTDANHGTAVIPGGGPTSDSPVSASEGAASIFGRSGSIWTAQAFLKGSSSAAGYKFGSAVAVSGSYVLVGAPYDGTSGTGAGSAYLFAKPTTAWVQAVYLKASNAGAGDHFGSSVSLDAATNLAVVGAPDENANDTIVVQGSGASSNNSATGAGAAYVFAGNGSTLNQIAYLKAPNTRAGQSQGGACAISGTTVAVGAVNESSNVQTVTNGQTASSDTSRANSGAVYIFNR